MSETSSERDIGGGTTLRPAVAADVTALRTLIAEAVDSSPYYNAEFKAYEKARLSSGFLLALIAADHWYVPVIVRRGEIVGFIIQIPDQGVLWAAWIYVVPRMRQTSIALAAIKSMVKHWDKGRFHKISSLVAPANERYVAVLKRFGFSASGLLRSHLFGEDYLLLEMPLMKSAPGYAPPVNFGRLALVKSRVRSLFQR